MSDDVRTTEEEWGRVRAANALRRQGGSHQAIEHYTRIIESTRRSSGDQAMKLLSQAYAGRGAAKLTLSFQSSYDPRNDFQMSSGQPVDLGAYVSALNPQERQGAIEDLTVAVTIDKDNYWAQAQLGEAHRSFARDHFRLMPDATFEEHIRAALSAYEAADGLGPAYKPWLLAHTAATHFHLFWHEIDIDGRSGPSLLPLFGMRFSDFSMAAAKKIRLNIASIAGNALSGIAGNALFRNGAKSLHHARLNFEHAILLKQDYAWAKRFYAFVLTCFDEHAQAEQQLRDALGDNAVPALNVKRSMAMLYRYRTRKHGPNSSERQELLDRAIRTSQEVMAGDSDDFFAAYAHATAISEVVPDYAEMICREARDGILNQVMRGILMAFALHKKGNPSAPSGSYTELLFETIMKARRDPELVTIAAYDPVWGTEQEDDSPDLLDQFQEDWKGYLKAYTYSEHPSSNE